MTASDCLFGIFKLFLCIKHIALLFVFMFKIIISQYLLDKTLPYHLSMHVM